MLVVAACGEDHGSQDVHRSAAGQESAAQACAQGDPDIS